MPPTPDLAPCEVCRRSIATREAQPAGLDGARPVWQCPECRGRYAVMREDADGWQTVAGAVSGHAAMIEWWAALADRGGAAVALVWDPEGEDADPVTIAATDQPGDRLTREGRARLALALPPDELLWPLWWHPLEPVTWALWDETPSPVGISERRGPRVVMREAWTRATDYGAADDPGMYGPPPHRASPETACAWWASMLAPIHLARVALLRAGPDGAAHVRVSARDRAALTAAATLDDPGFPNMLRAKADASRRMAAALGWHMPPE